MKHLSKKQLQAIHAKGEYVPSSRSVKKSSKPEMRKPDYHHKMDKDKFYPPNDIRIKLSEGEIEEWEKVAKSELISAKEGRFEGKKTIEVKFQNGEEWFEFQTLREQENFFDKNFEKNNAIGKFISVDHPTIEGYVNLISGFSLFKDREDRDL